MANWLVSGAASGVGRAVAQAGLAAGHECVLLDIDEHGLNETAGGDAKARLLVVDVADDDQVAGVGAELDRSEFRLDAVSLNIGIEFRLEKLVEQSVEDIHKLVNVNLVGTILLLRAVIPFVNKGGSVTMIASTSGIRGAEKSAVYSSTKLALVGLARSMCLELAPEVRINCVSPSGIETPLMHRVLGDRVADYDPRVSIPLQRRNEPEDIANVVMFLASPAARQITGSNIVVDAGTSMM